MFTLRGQVYEMLKLIYILRHISQFSIYFYNKWKSCNNLQQLD
jgi:hypothetical protein